MRRSSTQKRPNVRVFQPLHVSHGTMLFLACTLFLLLLFPTASNGDCVTIDLAPTLEQEFETASLVARLQLIQPP
jgi:hypothetical protein